MAVNVERVENVTLSLQLLALEGTAPNAFVIQSASVWTSPCAMGG